MFLRKFKKLFKRTPKADTVSQTVPDIRERKSAFSTAPSPFNNLAMPTEKELQLPKFTAPIHVVDGLSGGMAFDEAAKSYGMDSTTLKQAFTLGQGSIPDDLFSWFLQQGFIGYQACAIVSQNWLINKALTIPAKDAVRNGYTLGSVDGEEMDPEFRAKIQKADKDFKIPKHLVDFVQNTRRFGIRIAIFNVESSDPDYYKKPFNIDGVSKGSYKGISQVDPNWVAPILDQQAAANPAAMDFYEPTYWLIAGQMYHKSHVIVARYAKPPDVLMPTYQYGGIPLTQLILERVYAAERIANEAPMLAETKRLNVVFTDIAAVAANPGGFTERLGQWIGYRNNYGVLIADLEDKIEQLETSLADLDDVIMSQYQLVAAVAEVPATKLMGTSPKGFNATGEFELDSYHELLENIQTDLTPLIERHHQLTILSERLDKKAEIVVVWNPVSSPKPKEQAEINLLKAQQFNALQLSGAIDADEIRNELIADESSGLTGLVPFEDMEEIEDDDLDFGKMNGPGSAVKGVKPAETPSDKPEEQSEPVKALMAEAEDSSVMGYVKISPSLETGGELALWIAKAGISGAERPEDFHVTLMNSDSGIPRYEVDTSTYELMPTGELGILGTGKPALILFVSAPNLGARFVELVRMGGVSHYDEFKPHIALKYDPEPNDLELAIAALNARPIDVLTAGNETIGPVR